MMMTTRTLLQPCVRVRVAEDSALRWCQLRAIGGERALRSWAVMTIPPNSVTGLTAYIRSCGGDGEIHWKNNEWANPLLLLCKIVDYFCYLDNGEIH
jgi:hypothetical protein